MRTRLILILISLLSLCCAALIVATSAALHVYLVHRLDQQLEAAGDRYAVSLEHPGDGDADDRNFSSVVGQQVGTLGARIAAGTVTAAGVISGGSETRSVSAADRAILAKLPVGGPRDVELPSLGEYRVQVTRGRDNDEQVTGLPTRGVDDTITRLALIEVSVVVVAMLVTAGAGALCVRLTLRPLEQLARTARSVSELPLGAGEVQLPERLANPAPSTEVGQVTGAVNQLLGHVESALIERQATETLLRQFVADASHELRTPVAVIASHAEFIQLTEQPLSAEADEALSRITAESARMGVLIEELLLLARLDSGRKLARAPVDLTRLLLDGTLDAKALSSKHIWQLNLPEAEVTVPGDADSLRQVVVNLLGNAIEHTPPGTTVTVALEVPGDFAEARISDDGPGITADFLPHVFERFAQADSARTHRNGESGLGLSIVEAIVRAHDGTVAAASEPGRTEFTVRLPLS